jgi:hypothetical protein
MLPFGRDFRREPHHNPGAAARISAGLAQHGTRSLAGSASRATSASTAAKNQIDRDSLASLAKPHHREDPDG